MTEPQIETNNEIYRMMRKCPLCGHTEKTAEMLILEEQLNYRIIYQQCKKCAANFCGIATMNPMGFNLISFPTDLTQEEIINYKDQTSITDDDVLGLHLILENKNNNFYDFITKR